MNEIPVVCLSYNRAEIVLTHKSISPCILCVAESQEEEYRRHNPGVEIVTHPDDVRGVPATCQWIYDHFGNVFMVNDDISGVLQFYDPDSVQKISPARAYGVVQWAAHMAAFSGCYLFGFNSDPCPIHYKPHEPILLTGYLCGGAFGMLEGSGLRFNTKLVGVEDFWICGMNAYKHRKIFRDNRFCFVPHETFQRPGGLSEFRTLETEKQDVLALRRAFGESIVLKGERTGGGVFSAKNRNPYGRALRVPF